MFVISLPPLFLPHTHPMIKMELKQLLLNSTESEQRQVQVITSQHPRRDCYIPYTTVTAEIKEEVAFPDTLLMTEPLSLIQIFHRQHTLHKQPGCASHCAGVVLRGAASLHFYQICTQLLTELLMDLLSTDCTDVNWEKTGKERAGSPRKLLLSVCYTHMNHILSYPH